MSFLSYFILIFLILANLKNSAYCVPSCQSADDPHMLTFDGSPYEFQLTGDHYILYDDFKDTRITAAYQKCGASATCNCAVYIKKKRSVVFVDFCSVYDNLSPTSQLYGVHVEENKIGINAIEIMPFCKVISPLEENNKLTWQNATLFLNNFKCAQVQGGSNFDTFVIRTVEDDFSDSVKLKLHLSTRSLPKISIEPSLSSYRNTGGLCGLWDDNRRIENELYVMDENGLDEFLPSFNHITKLAEFWKLNSIFNKETIFKRCPECYLMSERSFYCPCDNFDLFNNSNYNLDKPFRKSYCNVPMHKCIEQLTNVEIPSPPNPPIIEPTNHNITLEEAQQICLQAIMNHTDLGLLITTGFFDPNYTIQICALDIINTGNTNITNLHIDVGLEEGIQNIMGELHNTTNTTDIVNIINQLCPNNCNGNGVCEIESNCLEPGNQNCRYPVKCKCFENFGGFDCGLDLTLTPSITLDKQCCDARKQDCSKVNIYGYPFSKVNNMYVKYQLIETQNENSVVLYENILTGKTISQNNIQFNIENLDLFTLYKNIKNKEKIPDISLASVAVYVSYINSTFRTKTVMRLYDSKCTDCNQNIKPNTCYVNGVCYSQNEPNYFNQEYICNPTNNNFTIDISLCNPDTHYWTEWFNEDSPDGDGDIETLILNPNLSCKNPNRTQIQTVTGLSISAAGQIVHENSCFGFVCLNAEQKNNQTCFDYQIRQCCPLSDKTTFKTTLTTTTLTTTTTSLHINDTTVITTTVGPTTTTTPQPTTTTTVSLEECSFHIEILHHRNESKLIVVKEDENNLKLVLAHNQPNCIFSNKLRIKVQTIESTAKENIDFKGAHHDIIFNDNDKNHEINIQIKDDNIIEPYEYFRVEIRSYETNELIDSVVVYIEDNDHNSGIEQEILDIFSMDDASSYLNPVYYDENNEILSFSDDFSANLNIFPGHGGIQSTYDQLRIVIEVAGIDRYDIQTIEINNPNECNLKQFSASSNKENTDKFDSIFLSNGSPLIDLNYLNEFNNFNLKLANFKYLVIQFETTKDGNYPGRCELRAFGRII